MNIWLVSPAWRRYAVTRLALAERRWLCDELAARGLTARSVIVADDDNLKIAREFGFDTLEMPNDNLGDKFNAGYRYAAEHGADIFVHVGSDDWIHPDAFNILLERDLEEHPTPQPTAEGVVWKDAACIVTQRRLTVVDMPSWNAMKCEAKGPWGCIPWMIPRSVLERHAFSPIRATPIRGIDGAVARTVRANWIFQDAPAEWLVDFKTDTNLTPFANLQHAIGYEEGQAGETLLKFYPSRLVELARRLVREYRSQP